MKYLCLGPAAMGIFAMIGLLKQIEPHLSTVEEYSGSSAGAILTLCLALDMSVDEIFRKAIDCDISGLVRLSISNFVKDYGFVETSVVRETLLGICGGRDPTFRELEKKVYISAFCLNTGKTHYFSRDTHPNMKVIDAVCMSMAIPLIFSAYEHDGYTFVDGGTQESLPATVFLDKKPHEVFCVRMKSTTVFREKIRNHADFFEALINSSLANRPAPGADRMRIVDLDVTGVNIFDFHMDDKEKMKLFNIGIETPCFFL
jgi:NTE family protein